MLIGYARVSTSGQDLAAQRDGLHALGVEDLNVHVDHGMSGTSRERPGPPHRPRSGPRGRHSRRHEARSPRAVSPRRHRHRR
ncbi:recombinase family protein [Sphingomonas sp. LR61]|uniref:recombinase family protein n=1 Tax=Sphingomonas sp. LR61 TaxID=3050234 RepID=UPI003FA70B1A